MKKLLILIVILILALSGLGLYLDRVYLPIKAKSMLTEAIQDSIGRRVTVGSLRVNILKGIVLDEFTIFGEDGEEAFLKIKQASFGWLFLPFIKKRQVIIPFINVSSPVIFLRRNSEGKLNIPAFVKKAQEAEKKTLSLIVYRLDIKDARVNLKDEKVSPAYLQSLFMDLSISLSLPKKIKYSLSGNFENTGSPPIYIKSDGEFDLDENKLTVFCQLKDLDMESFAVYYKNLPFTVKSGRIDKLSINAVLKNNILDSRLDSGISSFVLEKEGINYSGEAKLEGDIKYNLKTAIGGYSGKALIDKASIQGIPFIEKVEDLSGVVSFSPDNIEISRARAVVVDSLFDLNAEVSNFKNLHLKARLAGKDISLGKIQSLLAKNNILSLPVEAEGKSGLSLNLSMHLRAPYDLQLNGEVILRKDKLKLVKMDETVEDIAGKISFDKKGLSWQGLLFLFNKVKYSSSGKVLGFVTPEIIFDLGSSNFRIKAEIQREDTMLKAKNISGQFFDSEFNLSGDILLGAKASEFNLKSAVVLELADLKKMAPDYLPQYSDVLEKVNAKGLCNIKLSAKGRTDNIRGMYLEAMLNSDLISFSGFKLDSLSLKLKQENMKISLLELFSKFYKGKLRLTADADLAYALPVFRANLELRGSDLALLKLDTSLSERNLSGLINADLSLNGRGSDVSALKGEGVVSIKDGVLWELEPFKKLAKFLAILSFDKIVFNEAEADLFIKDRNIFSDEIVMRSPQMSLYAEGKVDFDGNIEYTVRSKSNKEIGEAIKANPLDLLSSVLSKAGEFVTVKVTGTMKNPEYRTVSTAVDALKEIKPLKRLRDQLKEIFN